MVSSISHWNFLTPQVGKAEISRWCYHLSFTFASANVSFAFCQVSFNDKNNLPAAECSASALVGKIGYNIFSVYVVISLFTTVFDALNCLLQLTVFSYMSQRDASKSVVCDCVQLFHALISCLSERYVKLNLETCCVHAFLDQWVHFSWLQQCLNNSMKSLATFVHLDKYTEHLKCHFPVCFMLLCLKAVHLG